MEEKVTTELAKSNGTLYIAILLLGPAAGLLIAAGCAAPHPRTAPQVAAAPPATENRYLGSEACAGCHAKEFEAHKQSNHAKTAHLVSELGKIALPHGAIFGSKCLIRPDGRNLRVSVGNSSEGAETLQYALGSGKTGITFVAFTPNDTLFEMRASYYPHLRQWYRTPGHESLANDEMGLDYTAADARQCASCHTTTLPADTIVPERRFFGVGCESCHGPGSGHVDAVKRNDLAHLGMEDLGKCGADRLNALCGRCHRTEEDIKRKTPKLLTETQRFQSYGIPKSRCFIESKGALSCLTCHDAHANASLDMQHYEAACLTCHGNQPASVGRAVSARPCPVNPISGCIPCHMPARKILPQSDQSPYAADHFIHIPQRGAPPSPNRAT